MSGCELRDNYHISFTWLFKKIYRYIGISVILSPIAGFLSLVRVTQFSHFPSLRRVFCVFNHKYIKWKYFLGISWLISLISNYFYAFTAFVLLIYIYFQRFLKSQKSDPHLLQAQDYLFGVRNGETEKRVSLLLWSLSKIVVNFNLIMMSKPKYIVILTGLFVA